MSEYTSSVREMIPRGIYDQYRQRRVNGVPDMGLLEYAHDQHSNVLLQGPTGSGKTMLPMAYAEHFGLPYYSIDCNGGIDPTQIYGRRIQDAHGIWKYLYGGLPIIVDNGGVLVVEEINMMPPKLAAMLYPLLDARRMVRMTHNEGEIIRADQPWDPSDPEKGYRDLLIVGTYNEGYRGAYTLNAALKNRFAIQLDWNYDDGVESRLIWSTALCGIAEQIRSNRRDYTTPLSTNALRTFDCHVADIGLDFAINCVVARFDEGERASLRELFKINRERLKADYSEVLETSPEKGEAWKRMGWDEKDSA